MSRQAPKLDVIRRLFALSGNICAFPGCNHSLISDSGKFIGQICHIEAAEKGGERYNPNQSDEDRRAFENLVLMCYEHHIETDDVLIFPVSELKKIKAEHESKYTNDTYSFPEQLEDIIIANIQKQLSNLQELVSESKSLIENDSQVNKETNEMVSKMYSMMVARSVPIDESSIYSEQLDFIKQLRSQNKTHTALSAALDFKKNKWRQLTEELRFKLIATIASIYFEIGQKQDAANFLQELNQINYENGETQAYLALAYTILNDKDKFSTAFEKANKQSANLWVAYIHMQDDDVQPATIKDAIPKEVLEKPEVLFTLGEAYIHRGAEKEGLAMLEKSISLSPNDAPSLWQSKGVYATKRLMNIITIEKAVYKQYTDNERQELRTIVDILSETWNSVRDSELAPNGWYLLSNRGIAYKALGDIQKARQDLLEAYRLSGKFEAVKNLMLHYIDENELDKANDLLLTLNKSSFDDNELFELETFKARLLTLQGNTEDAANVLISQLEGSSQDNKLRALQLITLIFFEKGAFEKALPYALQMMQEFQGEPNGYLAVSTCKSRMENREDAIELLNKALTLSKTAPLERAIDIFQIAMEYKFLKEFGKAAEAFELILNESRYDPIFQNLLISYFCANEIDKCLNLCHKAKKIVPNDSAVNEVLFRIYDELGENDNAENILQEQLSINETDDHFRLLAIRFYKKNGQHEKAGESSLKIAAPERLSMPNRMTIAAILLESDKIKEGLDMAYDARLDNFENSSSHAAYIQTLALRHKRSEKDEAQPSRIELNVAFILQDGDGNNKTYFLTDDKRISGPDIVRSSDSLGKKIINKGIGDVIEMPNTFGVGNKLTIVSIFNKYTHAFQVSQKLLETKYSDESGMKFFNGNGNFASMQEFLLKEMLNVEKQKEELYDLYDKQPATLGMLAQHQARTQIEVWMQIMGARNIGLLSYTHDESLAINDVINRKLVVVLDSIGLLTLFALLNNPQLLTNLNLEFAVATATIQEFKSYKEELQKNGPSMSIATENGELRRVELTQETIDAQVSKMDEIIKWCNQNASIKTPRRIMKSVGEIDDVTELISTSSFDTLLLGSELNGAVMSDDAKLKALAGKAYGLPTFGSYQLLFHNTRSNKISQNDFKEEYRKLIRANYTFIPVTGYDLWQFFDENGFKIQGSFIKATRGLIIMTPEMVGATVLLFAKQVYLNTSVPSIRNSALTFVFGETSKHRDFYRIRMMINLGVKNAFNLMPEQAKEMLTLLNMM